MNDTIITMKCNHTTKKVVAQDKMDNVIYDIDMCISCMDIMTKPFPMPTKKDGSFDTVKYEKSIEPVKLNPQFPDKNKRQTIDFDGSDKTVSYCAMKGIIGFDLVCRQHKTTVNICMSKSQVVKFIKNAISTLGITPPELGLKI